MKQKTAHQVWYLLGIAVFLNALLSTIFMLTVVPADIWLINLKTSLFLPASLLAHFSFLFFLLALTALAAHQLRLRGMYWHPLILMLFSSLLLIIIIDTRVFSLYRFHLNGMSLNLLLGGAATEILSFSLQMWGRIALIIASVITLEYIFLKWLFRQTYFSGRKIWPAILSLMITTQLFYGYRDAVADTSVAMQLRYIPWAQPFTMKSALRKLGIIDDTIKQPSLKINNLTSINYPLSPLVCHNTEKFNYLFLIVDSTRADMLNPEVMPNTYEFSTDSIVFNQHYSSSNSTRFGMFGMFYGLPSTYWFDMLKEERGSILFDILLEQNYSFHLDAAAPLNSPEFDRTIFSAVRDKLQWAPDDLSVEKDTFVIERLLNFLEQDRQQNFFAFSFLDAPHGYKLPEHEEAYFQPALKDIDYLSLDNDSDPEPFRNLYKSAIYYNDRLLDKVYRKLSEKNLLDNTVVIITSDHGQEFNELKQNYWGHNSNFSRYQTMVPLIIRWPGKPAIQVDSLTSHEDIVPSLLSEGLGCNNPISDYSTGYSLFDLKSMPDRRNLLMANWSSRAIFTGDSYYNFPAIGGMEILDKDYHPIKDHPADLRIIRENLGTMARYLK